ncbi:MAG: hypothetical protein AB8H80_23040 [Planctomycetota bacterium]
MSSARLVGFVALMLWSTLTAQSSPPTTVATARQVAGVARMANRAPLANATITLRWRAHPELPGLGGHTLPGHGVRAKTATADSQGRFRIDVPVAGPFELFAASLDGTLASLRKFPVLAGIVPTALQADRDAATPVQRRPLSGSVVDHNNNPLPFARIVAKTMEPHHEAASELLWVTYADHGGRFHFPSLLPGRLMVMAAAGRGGYATSQAKPGQQEIELRAGDEEPFEAIVLDAEEQPVAGAWVTMTCFGRAPADVAPAASAQSAALVAFTDAQGRVRFDSLPDGNWHLIAMRLHHTAAEQDILEMAGPTAISRGSEISVQLEKQ